MTDRRDSGRIAYHLGSERMAITRTRARRGQALAAQEIARRNTLVHLCG
jgi:hypothetical protein